MTILLFREKILIFFGVFGVDYNLYPEIVVSFSGGAIDVGETIFVHYPIGFHTSGSFSGVEHQRFLDPNRLWFSDWLIGSGGLPITSSGGSIGT